MMVTLCFAATVRIECATDRLIELPVGLWPIDCVKNSFGRSAATLAVKSSRRAVRQAPDADDPHLCQFEFGEERVVSGLVDQHDVARRQERPDDEIERMIGAEREQDFLFRRLNVLAHQPPGNLLPQRQKPQAEP